MEIENFEQVNNFEQVKSLAREKVKNLTEEERKEKIGNLTLMNSKIIQAIFSENKNNELLLGIINTIRKIHGLPASNEITDVVVESLSSVKSIFERNMTADILGIGNKINIAVEIQKESEENFAVRSTISSSNQMKTNFEPGEEFSEAPSVFGINILGFNLPELEKDKAFLSIVTRINKNTGEYFLEEKYSDYYICLPKIPKERDKAPENQKELWDICLAIKSQIKKYEGVLNMVESPIAKDLMREAVVVSKFNDTIAEALYIDEEEALFNKYIKNISKRALKQGKLEGKIEGKIEGKLEGKIDTLKTTMKILGLNKIKEIGIEKLSKEYDVSMSDVQSAYEKVKDEFEGVLKNE